MQTLEPASLDLKLNFLSYYLWDPNLLHFFEPQFLVYKIMIIRWPTAIIYRMDELEGPTV